MVKRIATEWLWLLGSFNHRDRSIVHLSRRLLARWRDGGCARVAVWSGRFCPNHYLGCAHCPKNGQPLRANTGGIAPAVPTRNAVRVVWIEVMRILE